MDPGSSAEILYYKAFQKMGLQQVDIKLSGAVMFGFNNESVPVIGEIELFFTSRPINLVANFILFGSNSPYNALLSRV
ncbi:hypothetical protein FRX31_014394 [Thalictrum thalictroides]|uniref:Uncharacterized protein n=1 Tax=Thalictrum thalictroides TaxID=46969 RepID=A0A7J6WHA8_THATH|nr:hypothetical protein FRX31_014394 [Thalictrum thalictroides]